ncbi:MAG: hypothetical protein M3198_14945 [Actinomycetota bacterium]|nr:hypothetical protein [Actinomycetota bacterium]
MSEKVYLSSLSGRLKRYPGSARMRAWRLSSLGPRAQRVHFTPEDADALMRELLESGNFCKDTGLGRIYHRRKVSLREISTTQSLHVSVRSDGLLSVHLDRISPAVGRKPGCDDCRYSVPTVVRHNVTGIAEDFVRLLTRRRAQRHLEPANFSIQEVAKELKAEVTSRRETAESSVRRRRPATTEGRGARGKGLIHKLRPTRSRRP